MAARKKNEIHLKYSLVTDDFPSKIGKRMASSLRSAIDDWMETETIGAKQTLVETYISSLVAYWKKTKLQDIDTEDLSEEDDLIVDLVFKKGRKPNTIRLENNSDLKNELLALAG